MPVYQKTEPRADDKPRRPASRSDMEFLSELQHIMNTQDTMGNRDPRFWVIKQTETETCAPEDAEWTAAADCSGIVVAEHFDEFMRHLESDPPAGVGISRNDDGSWRIASGESGSHEDVQSMEAALEALEDAGCSEYVPACRRSVSRIVPDTLVLAHADCEEHLRKYGYNYAPDAHAYAMTAVRSPRFERLVEMIQAVDWEVVARSLPEG